MIIGTNKETKTHEYRVALLPSGVATLVSHGHTVLVERGAGARAGWPDDAYASAGARMVDEGRTIFDEAELVYKVKEPMEWEYDLMRRGQVLFTYIHSAGNRPLTDKLLGSGVWAVAFEDVEEDDGRLPLLEPMSHIAGYMGMYKGFELLQSLNGGPGVLPGGMPGVRPAQVMILGGGFVGEGALQLAHGVGAEVVVLDIDLDRLACLRSRYPGTRTLYSNTTNIRDSLAQVDVVLNGVMWPKTREGHLITREMLGLLRSGAVIVDVSADIQGGIASCLRQTGHDDPVYEVDGVTHYAVANIPSLAARSASEALANVTLHHALRLADMGPARALLADRALRRGVTCIDGKMVRQVTAQWYGCDHLGDEELVAFLERI